MIHFKALIHRFEEQGEKTGWTYFEIPQDIAIQLNPGVKKTYRVKGKLEDYAIKSVAILPMGNGSFIMPLNASMRKALRKKQGAVMSVQLEADNDPLPLSSDLLQCLQDTPEALNYFNSLMPGHQRYFSNWIESAKTTVTKAKRIALATSALDRQMDYGAMMREQKK